MQQCFAVLVGTVMTVSQKPHQQHQETRHGCNACNHWSCQTTIVVVVVVVASVIIDGVGGGWWRQAYGIDLYRLSQSGRRGR